MATKLLGESRKSMKYSAIWKHGLYYYPHATETIWENEKISSEEDATNIQRWNFQNIHI